MILLLLRIRLRQLYREMLVIGWGRVFFAGLLLFPLSMLFFYERVAFSPYCYLLPAAVAGIVLIIQRRRQDWNFLIHLTVNPVQVCFADYVLFTLFVPLFLFFQGQGIVAVVYLLLIACMAGVPPQRNSWSVCERWVRYVPAALFEWKSGIRQNRGGILLAVLLGIGGLFFFGLVLAAFFLFTMIFVSFYTEDEPLNILLAMEEKHFLIHRLTLYVRSFALLLLPFLAIAVTSVSYAVYAVAAYLVCLNIMGFAVLLKYSYYRPGSRMNMRWLILSAVCLLSVILPFGLLVLLLNFVLYRKALKNLKTYFYVSR